MKRKRKRKRGAGSEGVEEEEEGDDAPHAVRAVAGAVYVYALYSDKLKALRSTQGALRVLDP